MRTVPKGLREEKSLFEMLQDAKEYSSVAIPNFPLKNSTDTGYYQVDVVLICNKGLFSIEVKNWNCTVHCSDRNLFWRVTYPDREIMVKSPHLQNIPHCRVLRSITQQVVNNLVVFSDDTKIVNPLNNTINKRYVLSYLEDYDVVYSKDEINNLADILFKYKHQHDEALFMDFFFKELNKKHKE